MNVPLITGVSEVADRYDAFLVDAWGVIHDGKTIYPGALTCLAALRAAGKRLVLISNASRRSAVVVKEIAALGIPADAFDAVVTSGEGCWQAVRGGRFGCRCYYLGPDYSLNLFDGLGVGRVTEMAQAEFLLVAGMVQRTDRPEFYDGLLRDALELGLELVCANSDIEVIHSGERRFSGGSVAQRYAALGGRIHLFGKPHHAIYQACLDALGQVPRERVLMVGDSFDTDIPGALDAGIDALFIAGGIHAEALGGAPFTAEGLAGFYAHRQRYPTAALDALRW